MQNIPTLAWIAGLVLIVVLILGAAAGRKGVNFGARRFGRKEVLSGNEREFLGRLERALPECRIHAQVAMGALLVAVGEKSHAARNAFSQKIVDFAVQDRKTGEIIAIVELDDRTHVREKDQARDAMLAQGGYVVIRYPSRKKPPPEEIRRRILGR